MIAAFDVYYLDDGGAQAAAVVFERHTDSTPQNVYLKQFSQVADYIPGSFYKRELPCILALLEMMNEHINTMIIDGYVSLGDRPGLGQYLSENVESDISIIGVAKNYFNGSNPALALRGNSSKPLYITAVGIDIIEAKNIIESMHGEYRIPTLLKEVDRLSKSAFEYQEGDDDNARQ